MSVLLADKRILIGVFIGIAIVVWLIYYGKKKKITKDQEHQIQRRMREEALDRALANPSGKAVSTEMFEKKRRPFEVVYSQGDNLKTQKDNGRMFEIIEITELSKRKYMFRCSELISIGNQFGTIMILPGTVEQEQIYCQLFFYQESNFVRSVGKEEVCLCRKGKSAVVNQEGIKLQSHDVVYVGKTMFQIIFL